MMKRLSILAPALAVAMLGLAPADASAEFRSWRVCGSYGFNTCAAVNLHVDSDNRVRVSVWNLGGWGESSKQTIITQIAFFNVGNVHVANSGLTAMYGGSGRTHLPWTVSNGWYPYNTTVKIGAPNRWNALGTECAGDDLVTHWASPCSARLAGAGWAVFEFRIQGDWDLDSTQLRIYARDGGEDQFTTGICKTTREDCISTTVTPEPLTMALLGTGLLGIGGAGAVRRRQQGQIEQEDTEGA